MLPWCFVVTLGQDRCASHLTCCQRTWGPHIHVVSTPCYPHTQGKCPTGVHRGLLLTHLHAEPRTSGDTCFLQDLPWAPALEGHQLLAFWASALEHRALPSPWGGQPLGPRLLCRRLALLHPGVRGTWRLRLRGRLCSMLPPLQ